MADVKLGTKTFSGVKAVKLNTVDGGTVTFPDKEASSGGNGTIPVLFGRLSYPNGAVISDLPQIIFGVKGA